MKKEAPITALQNFLPNDTFQDVYHYLSTYHVHLTVARERKTILGDYRHRIQGKNHRISINGNLNKYAFLITLLHELAHLLAFENYGNRILAHGKEWKKTFGSLLAVFIEKNVFPEDIKNSLINSIHNPAASSCADDILMRVLKTYDTQKVNHKFIENILEGQLFKTHDGKIFRKGEKIRKRFRCVEVKTNKIYLFSPVYEAEII